MRGLGGGEQIDQGLWRALIDKDGDEPPLVTYTITQKDVAGPFIDPVPKDYGDKASLKRLSYTSAQELLAEKFHMSEKLLQQLNPNASFELAGTVIAHSGEVGHGFRAKAATDSNRSRPGIPMIPATPGPLLSCQHSHQFIWLARRQAFDAWRRPYAGSRP
jgi:hypothetical protein